jgi:spermidine synthase
MRTFAEDARPWLEDATSGYDAIMVDAYRQPYIPFYLATREFFELARDRLSRRGVAVVNVGHPEGNDDLERVLGATMAAAFPHVLRYPIEDTNTLLVGSVAPISAAQLRRAADRLPAPLRPLAREASASLAPRLPGGDVYTDDRAPVEWLVDASLLEYAEDGG